MANMADVKTLRNKTGAGFADCKKALDETHDDINAAIKLLKKMGVAAAEKRSGRATGEGSIFIEVREHRAAILELLCETDFVARNDEFQKLGKDILGDIFERNLTHADDGVQEKIQVLIGTIKENMTVGKISLIEKSNDEIFASYAHGVPARIAAVVVVKEVDNALRSTKEVTDFAFHCALHSVARTPLFLSPETISEEYKKEQMDIIHTQVAQLEKPEHIAKGIAEGKWKKHISEICFLLQPWVHDEKSTAQKELDALNKSLGSAVSLSKFFTFILGSE